MEHYALTWNVKWIIRKRKGKYVVYKDKILYDTAGMNTHQLTSSELFSALSICSVPLELNEKTVACP